MSCTIWRQFCIGFNVLSAWYLEQNCTCPIHQQTYLDYDYLAIHTLPVKSPMYQILSLYQSVHICSPYMDVIGPAVCLLNNGTRLQARIVLTTDWETWFSSFLWLFQSSVPSIAKHCWRPLYSLKCVPLCQSDPSIGLVAACWMSCSTRVPGSSFSTMEALAIHQISLRSITSITARLCLS